MSEMLLTTVPHPISRVDETVTAHKQCGKKVVTLSKALDKLNADVRAAVRCDQGVNLLIDAGIDDNANELSPNEIRELSAAQQDRSRVIETLEKQVQKANYELKQTETELLQRTGEKSTASSKLQELEMKLDKAAKYLKICEENAKEASSLVHQAEERLQSKQRAHGELTQVFGGY
jgi:DNA repair exonuclease SbcCD ATPase subunit